jgi:hypothetical protein
MHRGEVLRGINLHRDCRLASFVTNLVACPSNNNSGGRDSYIDDQPTAIGKHPFTPTVKLSTSSGRVALQLSVVMYSANSIVNASFSAKFCSFSLHSDRHLALSWLLARGQFILITYSAAAIASCYIKVAVGGLLTCGDPLQQKVEV